MSIPAGHYRAKVKAVLAGTLTLYICQNKLSEAAIASQVVSLPTGSILTVNISTHQVTEDTALNKVTLFIPSVQASLTNAITYTYIYLSSGGSSSVIFTEITLDTPIVGTGASVTVPIDLFIEYKQ